MAFAAKNENDAKEKNKLAYEYYKRFDNVFTGPGKVKNGKIEPLPRKQSFRRINRKFIICPNVNEMIDKLSVYAEAGVDEIIISAGFGQSQNEMIESMHRISEEVIPYFKKFNTASSISMTISAVDCHYSITGSGTTFIFNTWNRCSKMLGDLCYLNYQNILV